MEYEARLSRRADYDERMDDAANIIYNSCEKSIKVYIANLDDPAAMWDILAKRMNAAATSVGRQLIHTRFNNSRPVPGQPISDYFSHLLELRNEIAGTAEQISDAGFKAHLWNTLPSSFQISVKVWQQKPNATIEEIMDGIRQDEEQASAQTLPQASGSALATVSGGHQQTSPAIGNTRFSNTRGGGNWACTLHKTNSHSNASCRAQNSSASRGNGKRSFHQISNYNSSDPHAENNNNGSGNTGTLSGRNTPGNSTQTCWHCGQNGHRSSACLIRQAGAAARAAAEGNRTALANATVIDEDNRPVKRSASSRPL